jgi:SAM-dependent methyltransferase
LTFKDHFSKQSSAYKAHRPTYEPRFFKTIASFANNHNLAVDIGCGSGQSTIGLEPYFQKVVGADPSFNQLSNADLGGNTSYFVCAAESIAMADNTFDMLTVGQALHWFEHDNFYSEARRILKPDGAIVVWCYGLFTIDEGVDSVINYFYHDVVGPHWPSERRHVENAYNEIPFEFVNVKRLKIDMTARWDVHAVIGMLSTWSATQKYQDAKKENPIQLIERDLTNAWGNAGEKAITWPITILAGYLK